MSDNKPENDYLKNPDNGNFWGEVGSVTKMGHTDGFWWGWGDAGRVLHPGSGSKGVCLITCRVEQSFYVVFLYVSYFTIKRFKK